MSKPPLNPKKTVAGIAVDPRTLERVIPQSRRPDGSVRKELKIRPGFTPQEDVQRFRGTRQAQMDATALPKGHIIGWTPPTDSKAATSGKSMSKSAKKNAKRKEKREEKRDDGAAVKDNWEDEDEDEDEDDEKDTTTVVASVPKVVPETPSPAPPSSSAATTEASHTSDQPNWAIAPDPPKPATTTTELTPTPTNAAPAKASTPRSRGPPNNSGIVSKLAAELKKLDVKQ